MIQRAGMMMGVLLLMATALLGCDDDTSGSSSDPQAVRETGYLNCIDNDPNCEGQLRCITQDNEIECVDFPEGCDAAECGCLGETICGDQGCSQGTNEIACSPPEAYDPCDGKACGELCTICDPNDEDCGETGEEKACNPQGECVSNAPDLCDVPQIRCETDTDCGLDAYCNDCAGSSCENCDDCIALCIPHNCETEGEPECDEERPECPDDLQTAVVVNGCWECVAVNSCTPDNPTPVDPVPASCQDDTDCNNSSYCNGCATSSCPECDDCVAGCLPHNCGGDREPTCDQERPLCDGELSTAVIIDGCWECVDVRECTPDGPDPDPGPTSCQNDTDCSNASYCDECASSSCPECDDCIAGCVPHNCETEGEPACDEERPQCDSDSQTAIVVGGCWECVELLECR